MPRTASVAALPLLAALVAGLPSPVAAQEGPGAAEVTVTRVAGDTVRAKAWRAVEGGALVLDAGAGPLRVPLDDVIEVSLGTPPDPARTPEPDDVALDLWSGEEVRGKVVAGDDYALTLQSPLLGEVKVAVDALAGLRFPQRLAQVAEPPELRTRADTDVVHLVGGDRIDCTVSSFGTSALRCATSSDDDLAVPYSRVTAVRLMRTGAEPQAGRALTAVLRDGTRIRGVTPRLEGGRLTLTSVSGFDATARLGDVVSVLGESDAFAYLSDLPEPEVEVRPFWQPVAGDPSAIFAPRFDRAFSGGLLRAAGRTWPKGIGTFSGTSLTWELRGAWRELRTQVAIDDAAGRLGAVIFVVEVDGKERWRSDLVVAAEGSAVGRGKPGPIDAGRIALTGAKTLTLRVLAGDADDPYPIQDEADWLGAMLVR